MPEVRVPAIEYYQKKNRLYMFTLPANKLEKLVRSHPRLSTQPEGVQRLLSKKRLEQIAEYISMPQSAFPNNIIINLKPDVVFEPSPTLPSVGTLIFPDDEGHFGDILDGQHRLYGIVNEGSQHPDLKLSITGMMLDDPKHAGKIFADINSFQKPVSKVLLVSLQRELGDLPDAKEAAAAFVEQLNEDEDSPLHNHIRMFQDERGKWITNDQAINILASLLHPSKTIIHLPTDTAISRIKNYLHAVSEMFPHAWGNNKEHRLTRSAGLEVVFGLFERTHDRARALCEGDTPPSISDFKNALDPIKDTPWDAETFKEQGFTSAGGRNRLRDALLMKLTPPGV